jgi:uncharacterized hydrophobic protein (TIGR00271 family)
MIVAPLMTPILGTMLAVVLGDRANLVRCVLLVVGGAATAIAMGFVLGLTSPNDVIAATNGQVAARVNPRLIDLIAALATGVVGSVALVRRDISDTLPGVAIAISLVPPLTVVGLTLEGGEPGEALGALLLFATNVAAILATGVIVMAAHGVHRLVPAAPDPALRALNRRNAVVVIVALLIFIGVPLTAASVRIAADRSREAEVRRLTERWADPLGWTVLDVRTESDRTVVRLIGAPPLPPTGDLVDAVAASGFDPSSVTVEFIPRAAVNLADPEA